MARIANIALWVVGVVLIARYLRQAWIAGPNVNWMPERFRPRVSDFYRRRGWKTPSYVTDYERRGVKRHAGRAVAQARRNIKGRRVGPWTVHSVFHYGAVDINPVHLVVWILLSGAPPDQTPYWYFGDGSNAPEDLGGCTEASLAELAKIRQEVRQVLGACKWPDADHVRVGFDSAERVKDGGGWDYFR